MIQNVEIRNFKSIKELNFSARRVNVFVGKPNVGKSNILEALSLFSAGYRWTDPGSLIKSFVRVNKAYELFFKKDFSKPIYINTDLGSLNLLFFSNDMYCLFLDPKKKLAEEDFTVSQSELKELESIFLQQYSNERMLLNDFKPFFIQFSNKFENDTIKSQEAPYYFYSPFKRYIFKEFPSTPNPPFLGKYLAPPFGENIVTVLYTIREQLEFFAEIFRDEYNLTLVEKENILEVQIQEGVVATSIPINLVADTLLRLMFYLTAIKSNKNSVLLFEEPETHSFPTYTNMLADNIARDSSNQYFITTHSPYLLRTLLDETDKREIAIFLTTYKDHRTQLHSLSSEEISELLEYDIDLFYNYQKFVD